MVHGLVAIKLTGMKWKYDFYKTKIHLLKKRSHSVTSHLLRKFSFSHRLGFRSKKIKSQILSCSIQFLFICENYELKHQICYAFWQKWQKNAIVTFPFGVMYPKTTSFSSIFDNKAEYHCSVALWCTSLVFVLVPESNIF